MNFIEKLKKEPRIIISVLLIACLALPWFSSHAESSGVFSASVDAGALNGFQVIRITWFSILSVLVPFLLAFVSLINNIKIDRKPLFIIGSLLGVAALILTMFTLKSEWGSSANVGGESVETKLKLLYGFYSSATLYVIFFVVTLVKEFGVSKEKIQKEGLKATITNVASDISQSTTDFASNLPENFNELSKIRENFYEKCPQCGEPVGIGKKFCKKCGYQMPIEEKEPKKDVKNIKKNAIIKAKLKPDDKARNIVCSNCGEKIVEGRKFCPECGGIPVLKTLPQECPNCKAKTIPGKKFCGECGVELKEKIIKIRCESCGAELIEGKKFCAECGRKVEE